MAARKKINRRRTAGTSSLLDLLKKKEKKRKTRQMNWVGPTLTSMAKVLGVICFLAAVAVGLLFLEEYVKNTARSSETRIYLELAGVPAWVSDELKYRVRETAEQSSADLRSDDAALAVQRGIEERIPWLDDIKVRAERDVFRIEGRWRKPLALVRLGVNESHYIDAECVVLDFVPVPSLPIVDVAGLSTKTEMPPAGRVWQCDELSAAITILERMGQMDRSFTPDKPLLFEIGCIDVSNFNGRKDSAKPHIVLYTKDNVEITWGAEWGRWQQFLESTDEEKLAKLYGYYKQYGTLSVGVKYINLRDPLDKIPLPIDKY